MFPPWMAAVAQTFSQWTQSWVAQELPAIRERSVQCPHSRGPPSVVPWCVTPMVAGEPWLNVFASHPPVRNITSWPCEVLGVCQQPVCCLPVVALGTVLDVGALWLYDQQLQRIVPVADRQKLALGHGSSRRVQAACADPGGRCAGSRHGGAAVAAGWG